MDEIWLTLPALGANSRVARLAIAGIATRLDLSYDDIEDVRIATGELFGIFGDEPETRVSFRCVLEPDAIRIEVSRAPAGAPIELDPLSRQILEGVIEVLAVELTPTDGTAPRITVRKQRGG